MKEIADKEKAEKKVIEKARNDLLKAPTINKRDADIKELKKQCSTDKKATGVSNKSIADCLKLNLTNAKSPLQKDNANRAIQQNKDNIKATKKEIDARYATLITNVKIIAKQMVDNILKSAGIVVEDEDEDDTEINEEDNNNNDDDNNEDNNE